jgi:hypothetical protein
MSSPLKTYRVYRFDGDKMAVTGDLIEAAGDAEAIAEAGSAGLATKCEIWDGHRLVAELAGELRSA